MCSTWRVQEQLMSGQRLIADHHTDVTVLFSDICSFTDLASKVGRGR